MRPMVTILFLAGTAYAGSQLSGLSEWQSAGTAAVVACVALVLLCDALSQAVDRLSEEVRQLKAHVEQRR